MMLEIKGLSEGEDRMPGPPSHYFQFAYRETLKIKL